MIGSRYVSAVDYDCGVSADGSDGVVFNCRIRGVHVRVCCSPGDCLTEYQVPAYSVRTSIYYVNFQESNSTPIGNTVERSFRSDGENMYGDSVRCSSSPFSRELVSDHIFASSFGNYSGTVEFHRGRYRTCTSHSASDRKVGVCDVRICDHIRVVEFVNGEEAPVDVESDPNPSYVQGLEVDSEDLGLSDVESDFARSGSIEFVDVPVRLRD